MVHSSICENADPNSTCECSCGGKYHGITHEKEDGSIRTINENLGSEVQQIINELTGKTV